MKNLISKKEAAELLNKKVSWLTWAIQNRKIPHLKLGQHVRFDVDALAAWLTEHSVAEERRARCSVELDLSDIDTVLKRVREHAATGGRIVLVTP